MYVFRRRITRSQTQETHHSQEINVTASTAIPQPRLTQQGTVNPIRETERHQQHDDWFNNTTTDNDDDIDDDEATDSSSSDVETPKRDTRDRAHSYRILGRDVEVPSSFFSSEPSLYGFQRLWLYGRAPEKDFLHPVRFLRV